MFCDPPFSIWGIPLPKGCEENTCLAHSPKNEQLPHCVQPQMRVCHNSRSYQWDLGYPNLLLGAHPSDLGKPILTLVCCLKYPQWYTYFCRAQIPPCRRRIKMVCKQMVYKGGISCLVLQDIRITLWTLDLYSPGLSERWLWTMASWKMELNKGEWMRMTLTLRFCPLCRVKIPSTIVNKIVWKYALFWEGGTWSTILGR